MVGTPYGEILLKALSHFGLVRVPRERVTQIFMGKRGRQYTVLAIASPRITATSSIRTTSRWCWAVSLTRSWTTPTSRLRSDVVEMWLGLLDIANMTKDHITFMNTRADPGELLAGLEASINIFHGTTRSTTTTNTKRNNSSLTQTTSYEGHMVDQILRNCTIWTTWAPCA